jgi:hypothetical protein
MLQKSPVKIKGAGFVETPFQRLLIEDEKNKPQRKMDYLLGIDRVSINYLSYFILLDLKNTVYITKVEGKRGRFLSQPRENIAPLGGRKSEIKN